ncbi:unnamed protein product [Rhizoctonia solani]|uniref:ATPase AAA-type core domain-containing protein n=1 Tax=Rhizoctonia solani TaxID=456999 RepID=A0A8H3HAN4_9AGAM|nr:unnamed protein product [Rhizoctonia solani]
MSTSTIKKLAAWFRHTSSTSDNGHEATPQPEKGLSQRRGEVLDRAQPALKGSPSAAIVDDFDTTAQVPSYYYLGFKTCNQFWDSKKDQWAEAYRVPLVENSPPSLADRIIAYNRKNSAEPHNNHIWIEIRNALLLDVMRPYFQGFSGFTGAVQGIDARHIYMQRKSLEALIPGPTELRELTRDKKIIYTDLQQLLKYIEQEFEEVTLELEHMKHEEDPQIRWDLLWALLTPGELLETTEPTSGLDMVFRPRTWIYSEEMMEDYSYRPAFTVQGEFPEWTGCKYTLTRIERMVMKYPGTKSMHTLAFKPLTPARQPNFAERGRKYIELAGVYHLTYESYITWNDSKTDDKHEIRGKQGISIGAKERAIGRVMIDIMSYRKFNPDLDDWDSDDFSEISPGNNPLIFDENSSDLCLLPPTVYGWSFTLKRWGQLAVEKLSPISFEPNAFTNIVLPEEDKEVIKALVEAQATPGDDSPFGDMIPGKGCGLVMLFHGNTGTGKTLTAEAISEHLRLPLYKVSSGDLGDSAQETETIETNLKKILEVIVILTTNYVRKIDKAIRSRVNLAVTYHDFKPDSRKDLWKQFLLFAKATIEDPNKPDQGYDFSQADLDKLSQWNTNGRDVKNIVQAAQTLARSVRKPLNMSHIQRIWKFHDAFETRMQAALAADGEGKKPSVSN